MPESQPLVSIAIPAFKNKYLGAAIHSALTQSYSNIELIIVNDHSPENLDAVIEPFKDKRIRYYTNDSNLGGQNPALNWNKCLSYAHGEFFALLCDDDLYEPDFIEQMVLLARKYPSTDVFRARANFINADGIEINKYASAPEWESWDDYLWHVCRNYRSQTISEWMFRREALIRENGYALLPLAWYADYLSIFRIAQQGGIASSSRILVHFRQSGDNISSQDDKNTLKKIEASRLYRSAIADLLENTPNKDQLLGALDWLLRLHQKYNLEHAPKQVLFKIMLHRKKHGISFRNVWSAFWH